MISPPLLLTCAVKCALPIARPHAVRGEEALSTCGEPLQKVFPDEGKSARARNPYRGLRHFFSAYLERSLRSRLASCQRWDASFLLRTRPSGAKSSQNRRQ